MITAKIIADSLNADTGSRLTTFLVRFHRFILPEVLTHRVFSRNTSSSRAIPVAKKIALIAECLASPVSFGLAAKPMYSVEENDKGIYIKEFNDTFAPIDAWRLAAESAVEFATAFSNSDYHKQVVNRIIEPYTWTDMVISSTEWDNFFKLRISSDAQPEIQELAVKMKLALLESTPVELQEGEWHLPFVTDSERNEFSLNQQKQLSVVRCARVSYKTKLDEDYDYSKDLQLFTLLRDSGHFSPFEHVAELSHFDNEEYLTNFKGFVQYRSYVEEALNYENNN